jgi:hypothetical protein
MLYTQIVCSTGSIFLQEYGDNFFIPVPNFVPPTPPALRQLPPYLLKLFCMANIRPSFLNLSNCPVMR